MSRRNAEFLDTVYLAIAARHGHAALHVRLDLLRAYSSAALRNAVERAVRVFPVLDCCYERHLWRDRWQPDTSPLGLIVHSETASGSGDPGVEDWLGQWINRPLDPYARRPFRVVQREAPDGGATLLISVLHAAADGAGVAAIVHELACSLSGSTRPLPEPAARGLLPLVRALSVDTLARLPRDLVDATLQPLSLRSVSPRGPVRRVGGESASAQVRSLTLAGQDFRLLRRACSQVGATLNDGLLALMAMVTAELTEGGPVPVYYTASLRRAVPQAAATAANLSAGQVVLLPRSAVGSLAHTTAAIARITRGHKRAVPGLSMALSQWLSLAWMPHAFVRHTAVLPFEHMGLSLFRRALLFTNVGALDEHVAPFGADLQSASIMGPFVDAFPAPIIMATGFRGTVTLQLCAGAGLPSAELDDLLARLRRILTHEAQLADASDAPRMAG